MPPKVKTTKEDIVNTAFEIVRKCGETAINARSVAEEIGCSTQPIFSNFTSMKELRLAVALKAEQLFIEYMKTEMEKGEYPEYKASGMAYIRFAKEEKELFKLLYMCDRSGEKVEGETAVDNIVWKIVHNNTGLSGDEAKLFHLEMWAYVHGIATMFATGYLNLDTELVSKMMTDAYCGLRKQYGME